VLDQSGELVAALQGITLTPLLPAGTPEPPAGEPAVPAPRPAPEPVSSGPGLRDELVRRLAEVLGTEVSRVDLRLSLREMGLDSIMATQLRRLLSEYTGENVPTAVLLEPTSAERLLSRLSAG
jgi:acyl carrier protein